MTEDDYKDAIKKLDWDDLKKLWYERRDNPELQKQWKKGKFFEYAILRAFEIEGAEVKYPFSVPYPLAVDDGKEIVEQIDGIIYEDGLTVLAESKDYEDDKIDIEPLAKLQVRLKRRPMPVIGCIFTATGFTLPAQILIESLMPHTILLWNYNDIKYCFDNHCFREGLRSKYRNVIEEANHMFNLSALAQMQL
jgi:hypothetical protein